MPVANLRCDPYEIRIDRKTRWGNPFSHLKGTKAQFEVATREEAIESYKHWLWTELVDGRVTVAELAALDGKILGCWCAPLPCHGEVLLKAAAWARERLDKA